MFTDAGIGTWKQEPYSLYILYNMLFFLENKRKIW